MAFSTISRLVKPVLKHWPWVALFSSLLMLAIAHAFETFGRMAPCELCLKERQVYWVAAGVAAIGGAMLIRGHYTYIAPGPSRANDGKRYKYSVPGLNTLLTVVFLGGAALAAYHAGAEWKFWPGPASCTGSHVQVSAADLTRLLNGGPIAVPACDKPAWVFLGISMAGWNALISLKLAVLGALAAWRGFSEARAR